MGVDGRVYYIKVFLSNLVPMRGGEALMQYTLLVLNAIFSGEVDSWEGGIKGVGLVCADIKGWLIIWDSWSALCWAGRRV